MAEHLHPEPLTEKTLHLCVDMQRIFGPEGPWATPWMPRVLPAVAELAARFPERNIFTRFITPAHPEQMPGQWRRYYERWRETTREELDPVLLELLPELASLVPPGVVIDKSRYSAFFGPRVHAHLQSRGATGLIVSGSETDVCVAATVLGAVDLGYRVILARDGVCSSSDAGHDALLKVYHERFGQQIETADVATILSRWR